MNTEKKEEKYYDFGRIIDLDGLDIKEILENLQ